MMMNAIKEIALASALLILVAACDSRPELRDVEAPQPLQEVESTEDRQIKTELFFGRSIPSGGVVSDSAWEGFRNSTLKMYFSGYTELDAEGYWTNDAGESESENSKVIIYVHDNTAGEDAKIDSVKVIYKSTFEQESVLQINTVVKAEF